MPASSRHRAPARPCACIIGPSRRNGRAVPRRAAPARGTTTRTATAGRGLLFHAPSFSIGLLLGAAIVLVTGYLPELLAPPVPAPPQAANGQPGAAQPASQPLRFEFDRILRTTSVPVVVDPLAPAQPGGPLPEGAMPSLPPGTLVGGTESKVPGVVAGSTGMSIPGAAPATTAVATTAPPPTVAVIESTPGAPGQAEVEAEVEADLPPVTAPEAPDPAESPGTYMLQAASFRARTDADRLRAELLLLDLPASTGEVNVGNSVWYRVTVGPFPDQAATDLARERLRERNLTAIPFRR